MAQQLGFYFDQTRCTGCHACQMACTDKNELEDGVRFRHVVEGQRGAFENAGSAYAQDVAAFWTSMACNHCDEPLCVINCPTTAMYKREEDGVVLVDADKCIGCRYCAWSCPYGAPQFSAITGRAAKCNFCVDLIAKGEEPACVAACPWGLIEFGPIEELRAKYGSNADLVVLPPSSITKPNIVIKPHRGAAA
jgi:anaerobic dimethyl sulfoxide reductase subunit B (iron-sulfur subunit)